VRALVLLLVLLAVSAPAAAGCLVALDVGHYTESPGETSARGVPELVFNQGLAHRLEVALKAADIAVTVINADGSIRDLAERPRRAREAGASLLLSLHHDSVQDRYKSPWTWEGREQVYSDIFSGYGLFISALNPAFAESRQVATDLGERLRKAGLKPSLHHAETIPGESRPLLDDRRGIYRYDELAVLRQATMPAVLIEAGIIVNRDDEPVLASDAFRAQTAQAVVQAVRAHCHRLEAAGQIN